MFNPFPTKGDSGKPILFQVWKDLLFLHWRRDPAEIDSVLPPTLSLETFDGAAWVGIVPFRMEGVRIGKLPPFPWTSSFPELNLRTYVTDKRGRPGVWFFSLDAGSRIAVWTARTFFHLNYRKARMNVREGNDGRLHYRSTRSEAGETPQEFQWCLPPDGDLAAAAEGTLEHFLVERYRLFAWNRSKQRLLTGTVRHHPYRIAKVPVERYSTRLFSLNGLEEPEGPPDSILAAPGFEVEIFPMEEVE